MKRFLLLSCALTCLAFNAVSASAQANPVWAQLEDYQAWIKPELAANVQLANNIISWQLPNGGFSKAMMPTFYSRTWDGKEARSTWIDGSNKAELATIDNDATVNEILFLSAVQAQKPDPRYQATILKAFDFLLALQYPSGGFAQVLPRRVDLPYSNMVTYNDDAMVRVLALLDRAIEDGAPFTKGLISPALKVKLAAARDKGVDFILKSQIISEGKPTVWCAQHDPVSYAPVGARAYELPSKSGSESVSITAYLMTRPKTPATEKAIQAALDWFNKVKVSGKRYDKKAPAMIADDPAAALWYRFYDLDRDVPFFCGRDGVKKYDIMQIEEERRLGYSWAGTYPQKLLAYAAGQGYKMNIPSAAPAVAALVPVAAVAGPIWFLDDFQSGNAERWDLTPGTGSFAVVEEPGNPGNKVLQYSAGSTMANVIAVLKDSEWAKIPNQSDYYVEARIKPQANSTTGNKQLFLLGRYQNPTSWAFGGLNVQNTPQSTQAETGWIKDGKLSRLVQVKRPMVLGTQGQADGQWYTARLEMIGGNYTVYFDGERMNPTPLAETDLHAGKIGLFTANRSFLIDDIAVGDPAVKPVQLTLAPAATSYAAEAGDAPFSLTVTARKSDSSEDSFSVASSDPTVAGVSVAGAVITVSPKAAGQAVITVSSGSKPDLVRKLSLAVSPAFVMPAASYPALASRALPAASQAAVHIDQTLSLDFDVPPVLGKTGSIRLFKASDNSLVDVIKLAGESEAIGPSADGFYRGVKMNLAWVEGKRLLFRPHANKLQYNTSYYVAIAGDALPDAKLGGQAFSGLGKAAGWNFTTMAAPAAAQAEIVVDDNGPADFRTVQGALNQAMKLPKDSPVSILVKNGNYPELLYLRGKNLLTIRGESREGVVINYNNYDGLNSGSGAGLNAANANSGGGRSILLVEACDQFTLDSLTLRSTHLRGSGGDQAETIYFNSPTGRMTARNASFASEQDTLQLNGYCWFYQSLVAGNVDYIWGSAKAALFEQCEIRTVGDTQYKTTPSGGYLLQARVASATDKGFVFLNCQLTSAAGPGGNTVASGKDASTYLGRSAANGSFDNIVFVNCRMGEHIIPSGWLTNPIPSPKEASAISGWREFGSLKLDGSPLNTSARDKAARTLSAEEALPYASRDQVFAAIKWNPLP